MSLIKAELIWQHLSEVSLYLFFLLYSFFFLLVLTIRLYWTFTSETKQNIFVFVSSANSLISSFLNFPIAVKNCKKRFLDSNWIFCKLYFTFWFCHSEFDPILSIFLLHTYVQGSVLKSLSCRCWKSFWFSLFNTDLVCSYAFNVTPLWHCQLSNSFFFPLIYHSCNLGHQFIYPSPLL